MEHSEKGDVAVGVDAKQIVSAGISDQMATRKRKQSERVAVVEWSAVVSESAVGIIRCLEGCDIRFEPPRATGVEVDEPSKPTTCLAQLRTNGRVVLEPDRYEGIAATQEGDI